MSASGASGREPRADVREARRRGGYRGHGLPRRPTSADRRHRSRRRRPGSTSRRAGRVPTIDAGMRRRFRARVARFRPNRRRRAGRARRTRDIVHREGGSGDGIAPGDGDRARAAADNDTRATRRGTVPGGVLRVPVAVAGEHELAPRPPRASRGRVRGVRAAALRQAVRSRVSVRPRRRARYRLDRGGDAGVAGGNATDVDRVLVSRERRVPRGVPRRGGTGRAIARRAVLVPAADVAERKERNERRRSRFVCHGD